MYNDLNINKNNPYNLRGQHMSSTLENLQQSYNSFVKQMETSDFSNSPQRYIIERNLVSALKDESIKSKNEVLEKKYTEKLNYINTKLDEFGIKISD